MGCSSDEPEKASPFFLTRHLLDPNLFQDPGAVRLIHVFDRIQELNKGRTQALAEHRGSIIQALTGWTEEVFLPRYTGLMSMRSNQMLPWRIGRSPISPSIFYCTERG